MNWPEIRKLEMTPSEFRPISGDWSELGIPNLAEISNKKLLNATKCKDYSFCYFWVIKGKPTGCGGGKITHSPLPRLRLICNYLEKLGKLGSRKSTL